MCIALAMPLLRCRKKAFSKWTTDKNLFTNIYDQYCVDFTKNRANLFSVKQKNICKLVRKCMCERPNN